MKILYLGTAAYEGVPSMFCQCRVCKLSRKLGGRNMRSRSQALVNDEILIDYNSDTVWHFQKYGFDWENMKGILITHAHEDHLGTDDVPMAGAKFSHEHRVQHFYAGRAGYLKLARVIENMDGGADVTEVFAGKRFDLADGKYSILPMPADHDPASSPLLYSIMETATGKRMLYAHDTGLLPEKTWQLLKQEGRYDLISLDCTGGDDENEWVKDHLCLRTCLIVLRKMKEYGIVDDRSKIVLNHFTHNAKQTYDEMKIIADRYGLIVSYDGLEVAF